MNTYKKNSRSHCWYCFRFNINCGPNTHNHGLVLNANDWSNLWEVNTTERPSFTMSIIQFHRKRLAFGSIPVVGSSWINQSINQSVSQTVNQSVSQSLVSTRPTLSKASQAT